MFGYNATREKKLTTTASIRKFEFYFDERFPDREMEILRNCSDAIRRTQVGLDTSDVELSSVCNYLGLAGSAMNNGSLQQGLTKMICATTSQVNMVSATLEMNRDRKVKVPSFIRLPSDLHHLRAAFFDPEPDPQDNAIIWWDYEPIERYTLQRNPSGSTSHYIQHLAGFPSDGYSLGAGSAGCLLARAGTAMLNPQSL
ncbi:hypothetical protein Moror_11122 [Moniliophthora roreri MCA 2997]|nr:hypothetical protein Moror_11122 [Moniliophthora roreri MCA 2997]